MKTVNKYLFLLAAVVFGLTACEQQKDREPSPKFEGKAVFFPVSAESAEVEPTATLAHEIKIARDTINEEALTVKLIVKENTQNIFELPETITFAKGVTETTILAKFPNAQIDSTYTLTIELEVGNSNPYLTLKPTYKFTVNIAKWDLVTDKKAIVFDGIVNVFYGTGNPGWYVPYARKNNSDGSFDIRLLNPYTILPEYDMTKEKPYDNPIADKFGLYGGFPYNYPEDVDSEGTYNMTIHVSAKGQATFDQFALGMAWTYGKFYGAHATSKGYGSYDKATKAITFPGGTVACAMADYKEGGFYLGEEDFIINLDDSLWQDIHSVISVESLEDGFNDASLTWNDIDGGLSTLVTTIQPEVGSINVKLQNCVDPNPKAKQGPGSDFYNLYRLADVYADGFGLAFYLDTVKSKISLPLSLQPTGLEFAGKDIYIGPSAENESYFEEIELKGDKVGVFHFFLQVQTKDGGNLGEYEEVFYFGPNAIVWEKSDYIGNFVLTGYSPFDGSEMAQKVAIEADSANLIMLGVASADTIILSFNDATGTLSIEPQMLPGVFTYQGSDYPLVLATFDEGFSIGFVRPIDFQFDLTGVAKLTATSPAIGYLVQAYGLGNLAGCYDLALVPALANKASITPRTAATLQSATPRISNKNAQKAANFKLQGQLPKHNFFFKQK